jgi:hypothetical protein
VAGQIVGDHVEIVPRPFDLRASAAVSDSSSAMGELARDALVPSAPLAAIFLAISTAFARAASRRVLLLPKHLPEVLYRHALTCHFFLNGFTYHVGEKALSTLIQRFWSFAGVKRAPDARRLFVAV